MSTSSHWKRAYLDNPETRVSWYQRSPDKSLEMIRSLDLSKHARIIDVGAGASRLVDHLLADGYQSITLLDIADEPLALVRDRLGEAAAKVQFVVSDIADFAPAGPIDLWHDRAVFHFLITDDERGQYLRTLRDSVAPGGHVLIATFGPEGPDRCSGLPAMRYGPDELAETLGSDFELRDTAEEYHVTPGGAQQQFLYCLFARPAR
ncbi:MAG: class I SAM-dependent methyltransferase [Rhodothermia bacterium]|nr:class I SAM-dependent methyltransferase [Rhodothermia bacterium]